MVEEDDADEKGMKEKERRDGKEKWSKRRWWRGGI